MKNGKRPIKLLSPRLPVSHSPRPQNFPVANIHHLACASALRYIRCRQNAEGSHNGSAAVLKTADRKVMQVRVLSPPPVPQRSSQYLLRDSLYSTGYVWKRQLTRRLGTDLCKMLTFTIRVGPIRRNLMGNRNSRAGRKKAVAYCQSGLFN
jgi:hypothetical protein